MAAVNSERKDNISHPKPKLGVNLSTVRHLSDEDEQTGGTHQTENGSLDRNNYQPMLERSFRNNNGESKRETNRLCKVENHINRENKKILGIPLNSRSRMVIYSITYFLSGVTYAVPAPFYPQIATRKGMSVTLIGFVFSVFQLMIFITSPFFGSYLTTIGPKFAFTSGIIVAGFCCILFGTLYMCPPGAPFFVLSLLVRAVAATGFSCFLTAVMAAASVEYPDNVATAFSILEGAFGVGMMVGPSIGGILYSAGGFGVPFYVLGGLVLLEGIFVSFIMPAPHIEPRDKNSGSVLSLLRSPLVVISALGELAGCMGLGFLQPTLAQHLEPFGLSVVTISLFFMIVPCAYTISAPFYGYLVDTKGLYKELIVIGQFILGLGYLLTAPTELLPFLPNEIWVVALGLFMAGMTFGCTIVPNYKGVLIGAVEVGYGENMNTYGLVSGLVNSAYSLGGFLGPMVGGVLVQELGDRSAYSFIGFVNVGMSVVAFILFITRRLRDTRNPHHKNDVAVRDLNRQEAETCDERTNLISP